jgi:HSP20 family protein
MNIDIKRWTPWNWLKGEEQQEGRNLPARQNDRSAGLPSLYNDHPLWSLHREMDRVFDNFFQRFDNLLPASFGKNALLKPNVDIHENKKNYKITVEVPGVEENDIKLELQDGTLTISGEKKYEKEDKDENTHFVERSYGSFRRVLALPQDIDQEAIDAKFRNGVLTITVPRKQMAKPKEESKVIAINKAA